ncbi:MAG: hypothetical protein HRT45_18850 [Bdellovibrionales bacterium]|nr:hypothetical protein [Bdellovibrionales bacterium]
MIKTLQNLQKIGGKMRLTSAERNIMFPKPQVFAHERTHVLAPSSSSFGANHKWYHNTNNYRARAYNDVRHKGVFKLFRPLNVYRERIVSHSRYHDKKQYNTLKAFRSKRRSSHITNVITGPITNDAAGMAYLVKDSAPYFVMRSRYNSPNNQFQPHAILNTSRIWLHELAHNLKLRHFSAGQRSICTDNIHKFKSHALHIFNHLKNIKVIRMKYAI